MVVSFALILYLSLICALHRAEMRMIWWMCRVTVTGVFTYNELID